MKIESTVKQVISELPTKVIAPNGRNYYLELRVMIEDAEGRSFRTFYIHPESEDQVAGMEFYKGDENTSYRIQEVLDELRVRGFVQVSPIPDKKFRVDRPRLPKGE